jgi:mannose-6-phosphate isomerase-like protein (cupin superfamily)
VDLAYSEREWRRYGHDRTYVTAVAEGVPLGYRDNKTGDLVPASEDTLVDLRQWAEDSASQGASSQEVPCALIEADLEPEVSVQAVSLDELMAVPWEDLSSHEAGQGARAKAEEELAERRARLGRFRTWAGRVLDVNTDERAWRVGAAAEETVGRELETLRESGWRVLHSVTVGSGSSDIDHILIGPGGVITVNSKHHPNANVWVIRNQIRINGQFVPYLRNSRHEAARAARILSQSVGFVVPAVPCLVFRLGNGKITVKEDPTDVLILRATKAAKAIRSLSGILNLGEIEEVYEAARRSTTWTT